MAKRKKYSYDERRNYHSLRVKTFVDKFRKPTKYGTTVDRNEMEKALSKNKSIQYSEGFSRYMVDSDRGDFMDEVDLKRKSTSYQRGWKNAQRTDKRSRSIKF